MTATSEESTDDSTAGFFRRNRLPRLIIGVAITVLLVAAYLFGITSYRSGLAQALPAQVPPAGGMSVVIVPERVSPNDQELPAQVLVFPSPVLLDADGLLTQALEVRIQPAVSGQRLAFPAGEAPAPQGIVLPAVGTVQDYPFDTYSVSADVQGSSISAEGEQALPTMSSVFFRVPGWSTLNTGTEAAESGSASSMFATELGRDGSTKSIALLLLLLMIALAAIAILVTGSATRGLMKLELSVASWLTALLFALIPLRGFFPGSPPLGSWMDILVFFWVELILMISVAAVAATILLRARDAQRHPKENS